MSLGKNIKNLRVEAGMSMGQLAEKIGKTRSAISQYESDQIIPRMGVIEDLARIFGVPKSTLIDGKAPVGYYSPNETELLASFRLMDESERAMILAAMRACMAEKNQADVKNDKLVKKV